MAAVLHLSIPVDDLEAAYAFYVDTLGCRPGRTHTDWIDVWFYGMQLTLQHRPDEVRPATDQGVRHFGVTLDHSDYAALLARLQHHEVTWLDPPRRHDTAELSGKTGGKLADPAGNIIEIKHYPDPTDYQHQP